MTTFTTTDCLEYGHDFYISKTFPDKSQRDRPLVKCFDCEIVDLVRSRQLNLKVPHVCMYCGHNMQYLYAYNNWNCWPCKMNVCYNESTLISSVEIMLPNYSNRRIIKEPPDKKTLFKYV